MSDPVCGCGRLLCCSVFGKNRKWFTLLYYFHPEIND
jgi:hypothetical protein